MKLYEDGYEIPLYLSFKKTFIVIWKILNNLYKFGLISEKNRDSKMKNFVEFDEYFKGNKKDAFFNLKLKNFLFIFTLS